MRWRQKVLVWSGVVALAAHPVSAEEPWSESALLERVDLRLGEQNGMQGVQVSAKGKDATTFHTPQCRGVSWERFIPTDAEFEPMDEEPCGALSPAIRVTTTEQLFPFSLVAEPGVVVRAVVILGVGCIDGRPFPLAQCEHVGVVRSPPMTMHGVGATQKKVEPASTEGGSDTVSVGRE